ncbi:exosortase-associated EpsI family protein [Nibricoccus sp. IMCC34717]|uniref:exosortase-associated EpsI family protein n=1 Tax=Nibricoccus sp. IMCC34717 TaxID=3034021 RepID=UPI00385019F3
MSSASAKRPLGLLLTSAFCVLATASAFALNFIDFSPGRVSKRNVPLNDYFPASMFGWTGDNLPLAQTESAVSKTEKILRLDEFIFRSYRKAGLEFSVYVAYWSPGKIAAREVAFHIPDKCWLTAGWERRGATYDHVIAVDGRPLAPCQLRQFANSSTTQNVIYWHLFNGVPIVYNRDGSPSDLSMLTDLFKLGLKLKGEQYFIRISSATPLDELMKDEGFVQVMELVGDLGPGQVTALTEF